MHSPLETKLNFLEGQPLFQKSSGDLRRLSPETVCLFLVLSTAPLCSSLTLSKAAGRLQAGVVVSPEAGAS